MGKFFILLMIYSGFCLASLYSRQSEDDLLSQMTEAVGANESDLKGAESDKIILDDVAIRISGTTRKDWVHSQLFFDPRKTYTREEWNKISQFQIRYFLATGFFYNVKIYVQPSGDTGHFICIIDLVDGFLYGFNFWPWDVSVSMKHLLGGNETFDLTLGLNSQLASWTHRNVGDTVFSYSVSGGHSLRYQNPGWIEDSYRGDFKGFLSFVPWLDMGVASGINYYSLPEQSWLEPGLGSGTINESRNLLGLDGSGLVSYVGAFLVINPMFKYIDQWGCHLGLEGGFYLPIENSLSPYMNLDLRTYVGIFPNLLIEIGAELAVRDSSVSAVAWPDNAVFRSSRQLIPAPCYTRAFFQITGYHLVEIPLGATSLTFNPYTYIETAAAFDDLAGIAAADFQQAVGAAVALGFGMPINLYFSFGVKYSINPVGDFGFLFSVNSDLL